MNLAIPYHERRKKMFLMLIIFFGDLLRFQQ